MVYGIGDRDRDRDSTRDRRDKDNDKHRESGGEKGKERRSRDRSRDRGSNGVREDKKITKYIYKEGDWPCPNNNCRNQNFAKRTECNRCGTSKPADANKSKSRSRSRSRTRRQKDSHRSRSHSRDRSKYNNKNHAKNGLFNDDDWRCRKCVNINFSWRTKCNLCNERKYYSRSNSKSRRHRKDDRDHRSETENGRRENNDNRERIHKEKVKNNKSKSLSNSSLFSSKDGSKGHPEKSKKGMKRRNTAKQMQKVIIPKKEFLLVLYLINQIV